MRFEWDETLFLRDEIKFNLVKANPIKETFNDFLDIRFLFCILVLSKTEMKMCNFSPASSVKIMKILAVLTW